MPGQVVRVAPALILGWASHPRLASYRVVISLLHQGVVVHSALAETALGAEEAGGTATPNGFRIDPQALDIPAAGLAGLRLLIGETDERIAMPGAAPPGSAPPGAVPAGMLMIEEILADAPRPRAWIIGRTYRDAEAAGLPVEAIVDLFYRDYLGRASDPEGLDHYCTSIAAGTMTYDDLRRGLLRSEEFRSRRKYLDFAPGSIFSQPMVVAATGVAFGAAAPQAEDDATQASDP